MSIKGLPAYYRSRIQVRDNGCWEWTGTITSEGYGRGKQQGRTFAAHRAVWEHFNGAFPPDLVSDHLCHDPKTCDLGVDCPHRKCVNPAHITATTPTVNGSRDRKSSSQRVMCPQGHTWTADDRALARSCPLCDAARRLRNADYYARYRAEHRTEQHARAVARWRVDKEELRAKNAEYRAKNLERIKAQQRAYREAHRDEISVQRRGHHAAHRDEISVQRNAHRALNRDRINAERRAWWTENGDRINAKRRARRALDQHKDAS